jgi:menaquinone-9 beta-reductase
VSERIQTLLTIAVALSPFIRIRGALVTSGVAVIGAGPAGCSAAIALARAGVECTLFEHGHPGKDKACGDAFVPAAVRFLRLLGLSESAFATLGGRSFSGIALHGLSGAPWRFPTPQNTGWVVRRAAIDQHLRDIVAGGCHIAYETTVTALVPEPQGIRLTFRSLATQSFRGAVIASGSSNMLGKGLDICGKPLMGASLTVYCKASHSADIDFHFGPTLRPGYAWSFPVSEGWVNLGVCSLGTVHGSLLRELAIRFAAASGASEISPWRGGAGALWSGRGRAWHHSAGILTCGDAAGVVDPSTGEGITAALESGWQAGETLASFLHSGRDPSVLETYSDWVVARFSARYQRETMRNLWRGFCGLPIV